MRVYLDSSALLKRVFAEDDSGALIATMDQFIRSADLLVTSSLAWVEVTRAARRCFDAPFADVADGVEQALSGVGEHRIDDEVISLAKRLDPHAIRSLDAVHVATAIQVDADLLLTYDDRMAQTATRAGVRCDRPGHPS